MCGKSYVHIISKETHHVLGSVIIILIVTLVLDQQFIAMSDDSFTDESLCKLFCKILLKFICLHYYYVYIVNPCYFFAVGLSYYK